MQMKENEPCVFALTPHPCLLFPNKPINGFWDSLWTLTVSHGFLVWHWQKKNILLNHTHLFHPKLHMLHLQLGQLCWCKGLGCYNKPSCTSLAIFGSRM